MTDMKRTCYIHVGMGKTGSSALQYALTKNQDYLLRSGFLYPDISNNFERTLAGFPTAGNAKDIQVTLKHKGNKQAAELLRPFSEQSENLVISCEGLSNLPFPRLKEFVDDLHSLEYDTKCLVFFRPQTEWIVSSYLQQIKTGKIGVQKALEDFIEKRLIKPNNLNWHARAHELERIFGKDNLKVQWYPSVVRYGLSEIRTVVFDWLGLKSPDTDSEMLNNNINPSPSREALVVMQMVKSQDLGDVDFFYEFLAAAQKEGLLKNKIKLSPKLKEHVESITFESNAKLLKRYCPELSVQDELRASIDFKYTDDVDPEIIDKLIKVASDILPTLNKPYLETASSNNGNYLSKVSHLGKQLFCYLK